MLQSLITRPLVKRWTTPSIRCLPRHHFAPPTFLSSPCVRRLSPPKSRYPEFQTRQVHKKAGSEVGPGKQLSDSSTDDYNNENGGSSSLSIIYSLALLFFILGARRRREGRQEELPIDANEEVNLRGASD